jgi:hypothetical protein
MNSGPIETASSFVSSVITTEMALVPFATSVAWNPNMSFPLASSLVLREILKG